MLFPSFFLTVLGLDVLLALHAFLASAAPVTIEYPPWGPKGPPQINAITKGNPPEPKRHFTCDKKTWEFERLAGYGVVPSDARDKYGDTMGGFGSAIAVERNSWRKFTNGTLRGTLYALSDRGWNTEGTVNYQNRIHKFALNFEPDSDATPDKPAPPNIRLDYQDTLLLTGPNNKPVTSLDPHETEVSSFDSFAHLPIAKWPGDGFGGPGNGGDGIAIDSEGLVLYRDGGFFVADEYGPMVYKFSSDGRMEYALTPPDSMMPRRNDSDISFSSDSPPIYDPHKTVTPKNPMTGRANNQGLEGLTVNEDSSRLYALMQSALDHEGGPEDPSRDHVRLLEWDLTPPTGPEYKREFIVELPKFVDPDNPGSFKVAAQSDIHYMGNEQFLILARDTGAGFGLPKSESAYRHIDIFDISRSTERVNIKFPEADGIFGGVADPETGELAKVPNRWLPGIERHVKPAGYCPFIDMNNNHELARFGLHNGGPQDEGLLAEKWESLATVPVDGFIGLDREHWVFTMSDNGFVTQDGALNGGKFKYKDKSGISSLPSPSPSSLLFLPTSMPYLLSFYPFGLAEKLMVRSGKNINTQILAYKIKAPKRSKPSWN